jgi:Fur family peroxide stress response transcriptional regulator
MIYEEVRRVYPNISLGTVYRNLTQLAENGDILRISDCGRDRFDKTLEPHVHFICDKCDTVEDIFLKTFEGELSDISTRLDCTINNVTVSVRGSCSKCRKE